MPVETVQDPILLQALPNRTAVMIDTEAAQRVPSIIRNSLLKGDIATANHHLTTPYSITGTIIQGRKLGRQLGFPTANLQLDEGVKLILLNGVYAVKSTLNGQEYLGMMNIGFKPTVNGTERTIEVHFFDFQGNLYGTKIQVALLHRLRNEHKFDSVEALREQLKKDKNHALRLITS